MKPALARHRIRLGLTLLSFITVSACSSGSAEQQVSQVDMVQVIDGDTVVIAGDERVRLIGIDTPEKGQCGFDDAKQALINLLASGTATFYSGTTST